MNMKASGLVVSLLMVLAAASVASADPDVRALDELLGQLKSGADLPALEAAMECADAVEPQGELGGRTQDPGWERWRWRGLRYPPSALAFERSDLAVMAGMTFYSGAYDADPQPCSGLFFHVPAPGLLAPLPDLGLFVEVLMSRLDRDTDHTLEVDDDAFFFLGFGGAYTFERTAEMTLMGQLGIVYSDFGEVSDTREGWAFLGGVLFGVHLTHGLWLHANPQFMISYDTNDSIFLGLLGLQLEY